MKKYISIVLLTIFSVIILALTFKGVAGNPIEYQYSIDPQIGTPFESTNTTARYTLLKSIVEDKSLILSEDLARLSAPDVVRYNGKFISIFTPGISFLAVPFYLIGDVYGIPQVTTFTMTLIFAVLNIFLVAQIAIKLGTRYYAGLLSGAVFLFGSNALAYAQTLTQHHVSTTIILVSLLLAMQKRSYINNLLIGLLFGIGLVMDIPNVFMMLPIVVYTFFSNFSLSKIAESVKVSVKLSVVLFVIALFSSISLFAIYNYQTTGSYTKYAQGIGRTDFFDTEEKQLANKRDREKSAREKKISVPLDTRLQLDGLYILLLSDERGWIFYSPILFIGSVGFFFAYKKKETQRFSALAISIVGMNLLVYSSFGDPWGGWSFGPRYLIPAAALMSAFIGVVLSRYAKNIIFMIVFAVLLFYSIWVNTLGVITTSAIPPKNEALNLSTPIPYTYEYNRTLLQIDRSSSLVYNYFFKGQYPAVYYHYLLLGTVTIGVIILYLTLLLDRKEKNI